MALRRARFDVRARVSTYFGLRVQTELAGGTPALFDAYVSVEPCDELSFFVGKMKSPIGLELLQAPNTFFIEQGLTSSLVPSRDVGAALQGRLFHGVFTYTAGIFNGGADGSSQESDENDAKDVVAHLMVSPFARSGVPQLAGLAAGLGGSVGEQAGALATYRTAGRQTFFSYTDEAKAHGMHLRFAPQAYYFFGPVGLLGEYVTSQQRVSDGASVRLASTTAWQVWGSFAVGGTPGYKGTRVRAALNPAAGNWGALEVGGRLGELRVSHTAFDVGFANPAVSARRARNFGANVSWWFATGTRVLASFERTSFRGGAAGGNRATESQLLAFLQVGF